MESLWIIENENGKARRRRAIKSICEECGIVFLDRLNGDRRFCSSKCSGLNRRKRVVCCCAYCKVAFERPENKLKGSRSGIYFCCRICKDNAQRIKFGLKEIHPHHYNDGTSNYRDIAFRNFENKCVDCGEDKPYLLLVHHKDGNRDNCVLDNLEIVCSNCHIKRHLFKTESGEWIYRSNVLTSRELLSSF